MIVLQIILLIIYYIYYATGTEHGSKSPVSCQALPRILKALDECPVRLLSKALPLTTTMHPELPSPKFWFVISLTEDLSSSNKFSNIRQVDPQSS